MSGASITSLNTTTQTNYNGSVNYFGQSASISKTLSNLQSGIPVSMKINLLYTNKPLYLTVQQGSTLLYSTTMNSSGTYSFNFTPTQSTVQLSIAYAYFNANANTLCFTLDSVNYTQQNGSTSSTQLVQISSKQSDKYRYGAGGQEKTDEISGSGNHYTAQFWEMDPRIGRRWNLDPKYTASESRYAILGNNPIIYVDPLGDFKTKFGAWLYKQAHGGEISRDTKSGQYFVGKQVEYTGEGAGVAYQRRFDWNGGSQAYTGSGWGHTARSFFANMFGVNGKASSLIDLGMNSVLQNSSTQLAGDLLEKVKQDPAVQNLENDLVRRMQGDSRYGKEAFTYSSSNNPVQLGGQRGSLNPLDPNSAATWNVAANPLTWAVRSVNIEVQVKVSAEGCMNITYSFTDNFDLRPEQGGKVYFGGSGNSPFSSGGGQRPWQYNAATSVLGVPYHDILGGNDQMKINATWQSNR